MLKHTAQELGISQQVAEHFNRLAPVYDAKAVNRENYLRTIDDLIVSHISQTGAKRPRLLDVGTGTGTRLEGLKQRIPRVTAYGCDLSPKMLALAKGKSIDDLRMADMSDLPYDDGSFDHVLSLFNVFGYGPSKQKRQQTAREFYRVLRPGGTAMIDILNRWHLGEGEQFHKSPVTILKELAKSALDPSLEFGDVIFKANDIDSSHKSFFHSFTDMEARALFMSVGFRVLDAKVIGYDTGKIHEAQSKGNLFYILEKPLQ